MKCQKNRRWAGEALANGIATGRKMGLEEGIGEGLEMAAKEMRIRCIDADFISEVTGLSLDAVSIL